MKQKHSIVDSEALFSKTFNDQSPNSRYFKSFKNKNQIQGFPRTVQSLNMRLGGCLNFQMLIFASDFPL